MIFFGKSQREKELEDELDEVKKTLNQKIAGLTESYGIHTGALQNAIDRKNSEIKRLQETFCNLEKREEEIQKREEEIQKREKEAKALEDSGKEALEIGKTAASKVRAFYEDEQKIHKFIIINLKKLVIKKNREGLLKALKKKVRNQKMSPKALEGIARKLDQELIDILKSRPRMDWMGTESFYSKEDSLLQYIKGEQD